MNKLCLLLLAVIIHGCSHRPGPNAERNFHRLEFWLSEKDFFRARDSFAVYKEDFSDLQRLMIEANLDNTFNRLEQSNRQIRSLLKDHSKELTDTAICKLLQLKQANSAKLFEYKDAYETIGEILGRYRPLLTADEIKDHENSNIIWKALAGQPKQVVRIHNDALLTIKRDKVGLPNLLVKADTVQSQFIFDTGANLCTATESTAKKFNMQLMDGVVEVGAITGLKVNARIAVCPVLTLREVEVRNAVFLVFPDSALRIPQIDFQMHGIIGFPVIEAMKEIQMSENILKIPAARTVFSSQNLALDFLTPVISIDGRYFTFDSGAGSTILYRKYFELYKDSIGKKYPETDINLGGAGGAASRKGYHIPFEAHIGNSTIRIDKVAVLKENMDKEHDHYYGNIGQDLIRKFHTMTINFESMFIKFQH